jgi:thiol-disulfide isomerase/thioredoxin
MNFKRVLKAALPWVFVGLAVAPASVFAASDIPVLRPERWVNSAPLVPEALRGQVVLVDFWEYTCINWDRTSPYLKAWHRDYAPAGLTVIGVHAPEFEFGKQAANIDRGIRDHGLTYPVAIDNDFSIWRAFGNDAWPAKYLFDGDGKLVRRWAGEGRYDEIEGEIRRLLMAAHPGAALPPMSAEVKAFAKAGEPDYRGITPETYLGAERGEWGAFRLKGAWKYHSDAVELQAGTGSIVMPFVGGEANLVVQPGPRGRATLTVLLDGKPVGADAHGADVDADGVARFDRSGMLRLVAGASRQKHVLTLIASEPGLQAHVFTFGP